MRNNRAAPGQMVAPPTRLSNRKAGRQPVFVSGIIVTALRHKHVKLARLPNKTGVLPGAISGIPRHDDQQKTGDGEQGAQPLAPRGLWRHLRGQD